jgi:delta14-sterol reductase
VRRVAHRLRGGPPARAAWLIIRAVHSLTPISLSSLATAALVYGAFFFALLLLAIVLPGKVVTGFPQPDGATKTYRMNGPALWVATHIFVIGSALVLQLSLAPLVRDFWSYLVVANVWAFAWSGILYVRGRKLGCTPRPGLLGLVQDLWYGIELNPTWRGVDLKVWAYQPSLIGVSILNVAFAFVQWETYGTLTPQMIAYQSFWWLYMTTHYIYEAGVLSMWDVIAEKFGFMLVWGDLVLVTFFYCIGGWWLVHDTTPMATAPIVGLVLLHLGGLWIFRGANAQKDRFKRDRTALIWGRPPETIGGRLLVSGWWGIGRKINYTGEIMVYFSLALCTGFQSPLPYLVPIWLCCLLPHRAWRDEKRCREKYGELWQAYTRRARFRMIPFVY